MWKYGTNGTGVRLISREGGVIIWPHAIGRDPITSRDELERKENVGWKAGQDWSQFQDQLAPIRVCGPSFDGAANSKITLPSRRPYDTTLSLTAMLATHDNCVT